MKSCCTACKKGKPCGSDTKSHSLAGLFKRSVGYGVYGQTDAVPPAPAPAAPAVEQSTLPFGMSKETLIAIIAVVVGYKILF